MHDEPIEPFSTGWGRQWSFIVVKLVKVKGFDQFLNSNWLISPVEACLERFVDDRDFLEICGKLNCESFEEWAWTTFLLVEQNRDDCAQLSFRFIDVYDVHLYVVLLAI